MKVYIFRKMVILDGSSKNTISNFEEVKFGIGGWEVNCRCVVLDERNIVSAVGNLTGSVF